MLAVMIYEPLSIFVMAMSTLLAASAPLVTLRQDPKTPPASPTTAAATGSRVPMTSKASFVDTYTSLPVESMGVEILRTSCALDEFFLANSLG